MQAGMAGYTLLLWPDEHKIEVTRTPITAQRFIIDNIRNKEEEGYIDPYTELIRKLHEKRNRKRK